MFVRIDRDLSVNINNIFSYKLSEEADSIKLTIWSNEGKIVHNIFYLKDVPEQMNILIQFNEVMRDLTVNPEIIRQNNIDFDENVFNKMQEQENKNHLEESINKESLLEEN